MKRKITLREARNANKLPAELVAAIMGIKLGTLYNWEKGITAPNIDQFNDLIAVYGLNHSNIRFPIKRILDSKTNENGL